MAILHIVPRPRPEEPSALARALADAPWTGPDSDGERVLELFEPHAAAPVVDLSLADRDVPELVALLHQCAEVHVHGVHPRIAMHHLPAVRAAALAGVTLVVHGPIAPLVRDLPRSNERLSSWPGPVQTDALARATLGGELDASADAPAAGCDAIDPADPLLLPRACGAIPLFLEDGTTLAVIGLVAEIPDAVRIPLRFAIESLNRPSFRVEVCDEATVPAAERLARRRALQAVIVPQQPAWEPGRDEVPWSRSMLESVAQGLPILVLGPARPDAPPGVLFTGAREDHDRCVACLRSWVSTWAHGRAIPFDDEARAAWLSRHTRAA